jgi:hypothetical protein
MAVPTVQQEQQQKDVFVFFVHGNTIVFLCKKVQKNFFQPPKKQFFAQKKRINWVTIWKRAKFSRLLHFAIVSNNSKTKVGYFL